MNGVEHYREAERLLRDAGSETSLPDATYVVQLAQAHALLASAAPVNGIER